MNITEVKKVLKSQPTFTQNISDKVTHFVGSWWFILFQTILFVIWLMLNLFLLTKSFDPYPFIFLNLVLAFENVYITPLIMMSQNRQDVRDRMRDDADFEQDLRAVRNTDVVRSEIEALKQEIAELKKILLEPEK